VPTLALSVSVVVAVAPDRLADNHPAGCPPAYEIVPTARPERVPVPAFDTVTVAAAGFAPPAVAWNEIDD
jgi:hypothetical protein